MSNDLQVCVWIVDLLHSSKVGELRQRIHVGTMVWCLALQGCEVLDWHNCFLWILRGLFFGGVGLGGTCWEFFPKYWNIERLGVTRRSRAHHRPTLSQKRPHLFGKPWGLHWLSGSKHKGHHYAFEWEFPRSCKSRKHSAFSSSYKVGRTHQ